MDLNLIFHEHNARRMLEVCFILKEANNAIIPTDRQINTRREDICVRQLFPSYALITNKFKDLIINQMEIWRYRRIYIRNMCISLIICYIW